MCTAHFVSWFQKGVTVSIPHLGNNMIPLYQCCHDIDISNVDTLHNLFVFRKRNITRQSYVTRFSFFS